MILLAFNDDLSQALCQPLIIPVSSSIIPHIVSRISACEFFIGNTEGNSENSGYCFSIKILSLVKIFLSFLYKQHNSKIYPPIVFLRKPL